MNYQSPDEKAKKLIQEMLLVESKDEFKQKISDKIFFRLTGKVKNDSIISRKYLDLNIEYRLDPVPEKENNALIVVSKNLASLFGITEDELFHMALNNFTGLYEPRMINVMKMLQDEVGELPDGLYTENEIHMYVLTNKAKHAGASVVLKPGLLKTLASGLESDLILLPSSIHEWMIIRNEEHPLSEMNLEELRSLVRTVNSEWVSNDDVLSDNVYYYCRQTDCFMLVDDIKKFEQNTKLTGKERQTGGLFFMGKI